MSVAVTVIRGLRHKRNGRTAGHTGHQHRRRLHHIGAVIQAVGVAHQKRVHKPAFTRSLVSYKLVGLTHHAVRYGRGVGHAALRTGVVIGIAKRLARGVVIGGIHQRVACVIHPKLATLAPLVLQPKGNRQLRQVRTKVVVMTHRGVCVRTLPQPVMNTITAQHHEDITYGVHLKQGLSTKCLQQVKIRRWHRARNICRVVKPIHAIRRAVNNDIVPVARTGALVHIPHFLCVIKGEQHPRPKHRTERALVRNQVHCPRKVAVCTSVV